MTKILLLANDHPDDISLQESLKLYGYELITTSQTNELLALAADVMPDLILIEMDTPGVNTWQTIQTLKRHSSTWCIPAIALCEPFLDGKILLQAGFDSYFRRPIFLKYLFMRIDVLVKTNPASQNQECRVPTHPPTMGTSTIPSEPAYAAKPVPQTTVVHVDDSSKDSQAMAEIIERAGYSYANISNPLETLPELLERKPKLIFLDLVMPMANGYEICSQIRRISTFSDTPIVIMTNNDGVIDRVRANIVGASDFLTKPIEDHRVLRMVKKYLNPFQSVPSSHQRFSLLEKLNPLKILSR